MEIHCLLPFLRKLKSVCGPVRLPLFLLDKFVIRRQLKRFRKNRNCSLARESIYLTAVTHTADGCVNNIKFVSYLTGNRPLICKTHSKEAATFCYTNYFPCHTLKRVNTGFAKGEALRLLVPNSSRSTSIKKTYRVSNMLKE